MDVENEQVARVEERTTPPTPVIYDVVRRYGEDEMRRPATSLWWSGLAAGLSMSFSVLAQAILRVHLPAADWAELVTALGYPVGFVMVVLARQQLFTENTLTVVLPVMAHPSRHRMVRALRLWLIVLAANLTGTLLSAAFYAFTPVIDDAMRDAILGMSERAIAHDPATLALQGIGGGFLMAAMVWLIPAANAAQFHVVVLVTYLIGLGPFAHVVVGSMEAFLLMLSGRVAPPDALAGFLLPVLAGNVIGGTALFALLSYAQVMKEIR